MKYRETFENGMFLVDKCHTHWYVQRKGLLDCVRNRLQGKNSSNISTSLILEVGAISAFIRAHSIASLFCLPRACERLFSHLGPGIAPNLNRTQTENTAECEQKKTVLLQIDILRLICSDWSAAFHCWEKFSSWLERLREKRKGERPSSFWKKKK